MAIYEILKGLVYKDPSPEELKFLKLKVEHIFILKCLYKYGASTNGFIRSWVLKNFQINLGRKYIDRFITRLNEAKLLWTDQQIIDGRPTNIYVLKELQNLYEPNKIIKMHKKLFEACISTKEVKYKPVLQFSINTVQYDYKIYKKGYLCYMEVNDTTIELDSNILKLNSYERKKACILAHKSYKQSEELGVFIH